MSEGNAKVEVYSAHYVKLNTACAYQGVDGGCDGDITVIRVSQITDGTIRVATMCYKHHLGEKESIIADGFVFAGECNVAGVSTDAVLVNPDAVKLAKDLIQRLPRKSRN